MKMLARFVYGAVGVAGVGTLWWMINNLSTFQGMEMWSQIGFVLLLIGGLNWGIVALTGDCKKDLFGLLKLN
jgi:uncharacterized membrane protein YuzA (DUF378 family)